jgi:predicted ABC-type ATPase
MHQTRPTLTLIAGINGAGKSSTYAQMDDDEKNNLGPRINPDDLTKSHGSVIAGGKAAVKLRNQYLSGNKTFHQETTLTGQSILKIIDKAKSKDYKLSLIYVSVDSVETAIKRVAGRVKRGGHDIPTETIRKRYPESLKNLQEQIHKFDDVELIDNTDSFETVFQTLDKNIVLTSDNLPEWVQLAIKALGQSTQ